MEGVEFLLVFSLELDAGAELSEKNQVEDDGGSQERVLTGVVHHDSVLSSHEYLRSVLIHGSLAITHIWHILDDYDMIRVFTRLIEDAIASNHVIDHIALRYLFGPESLRC
uniref:Uncharacterized protein n=1 Tax=Opuntia streptacantha TaxID=393608 RepID=A0A7C9CT11_OPUST